MSNRSLAPGDIVAGKYRIERVVGEGGMGVVLAARHVTLDEPVAIKVLRVEATASTDATARFMREARAAARMKGEHVAKVLDVGTLEDGSPYMLMELLEGADLSAVVERDGWLPVHTAVDYVLQTCEALAEAHAVGIIHRDIKPSNLFLTTRLDGSPCVKVLDFGIAKATSPIDATRPDYGLTQTQSVMGSPQYMAPEQMRSARRVDGRTDIWALGTVMHELLTGIPPFSASTMPELFAMILQDEAPLLRARRPDVPPELDRIVQRCLEKAPAGRHETVLELARELVPFGSSLSADAAERIDRVGRNAGTGSNASLQAAARPSRGALPASRAVPSSSGGVAGGIAPSSPELAHAHTLAGGASGIEHSAAFKPQRRTVRAQIAGVFAVVLLGAAAAAVFAVRARPPRAAAATAVPITSAPVEAPTLASPLTALDPAPPTTYNEPSPEPPGSAKPGASARSLHGLVPHAPVGARPRPPTTQSPPSSAPVEHTTPPQPATTASSRYD